MNKIEHRWHSISTVNVDLKRSSTVHEEGHVLVCPCLIPDYQYVDVMARVQVLILDREETLGTEYT